MNHNEETQSRLIVDGLLTDEAIDAFFEKQVPINNMLAYYRCAIMEVETKFRVLNEQFSLKYDRNPIESIKSRIKSNQSIIKKMRKKKIPPTLSSVEKEICDIAGVRVICSFEEDAYHLANCILQQDDIKVLKIKDYIKNPKPNGYRSLHLIVEISIFLENEKRPMKVEIQLRTLAMDLWASQEHKIRYKKNIPAEEEREVHEKLYECASIMAEVDKQMQALWTKVSSPEYQTKVKQSKRALSAEKPEIYNHHIPE